VFVVFMAVALLSTGTLAALSGNCSTRTGSSRLKGNAAPSKAAAEGGPASADPSTNEEEENSWPLGLE
jgi:hypothetical protein